MYKLISLDLDGTLLNSEKKISLKTLNLLKELNNKKIKIVFNTGRSYFDLLKVLEGYDHLNYSFICNNGVQIIHQNIEMINSFLKTVDDNFIEKLSIDYKIIKLNKNKKNYYLKIDDLENEILKLIEHEDESKKINEIEIYKNIIFQNAEEINDFSFLQKNNESIMKISIISTEDKVNNLVSLKNENYDFVKVFKTNVEIIPKNTNKLLGLNILLKKLSISLNEVVAFGDEENDLILLENVGLGIAMKNSSDLLLKKIKTQTLFTNDEDGVYMSLKKIFKEIL